VGSGALNAVNKVGTFCGMYVMLLKYVLHFCQFNAILFIEMERTYLGIPLASNPKLKSRRMSLSTTFGCPRSAWLSNATRTESS
jgi:hypothetical protein